MAEQKTKNLQLMAELKNKYLQLMAEQKTNTYNLWQNKFQIHKTIMA